MGSAHVRRVAVLAGQIASIRDAESQVTKNSPERVLNDGRLIFLVGGCVHHLMRDDP